jgi:hypothetical protein
MRDFAAQCQSVFTLNVGIWALSAPRILSMRKIDKERFIRLYALDPQRGFNRNQIATDQPSVGARRGFTY